MPKWEVYRTGNPITKEELRITKEGIRLGDRIECSVVSWKAWEGGKYPVVRRKLEVVGKYRHLAVLRDRRTGFLHSMTYAEIAVKNRKKGKEDEHYYCGDRRGRAGLYGKMQKAEVRGQQGQR